MYISRRISTSPEGVDTGSAIKYHGLNDQRVKEEMDPKTLFKT